MCREERANQGSSSGKPPEACVTGTQISELIESASFLQGGADGKGVWQEAVSHQPLPCLEESHVSAYFASIGDGTSDEFLELALQSSNVT
jgi:hypothetical protein